MQTKVISRRSSKTTIIVAILVFVFLLGISGYITYKKGYIKRFSASDNTSASEIAATTGGTPPNTVSYSPPNQDDNIVIPDKNPNPAVITTEKNDTTVVVTQVRKSTDGSSVLIKAIVTGMTSGTCSVAATKEQQTLSATSGISLSGGQYACDALSIPLSSFKSSGKWLFTVTATSSTGASASSMQEAQVDL